MKRILFASGIAVATAFAEAPARGDLDASRPQEKAPRRPSPPRFELSPSIGYQVSQDASTPDGRRFDFDGAPTYGATFSVYLAVGNQLQALYRVQNTHVDSEPVNGPSERLHGVTIHYFRVGSEQDILPGKRVRPFISLSFGGTLFDPRADVESELRFSASGAIGVKASFTRAVGLRAEGRLTATFLDDGDAVLCGTATGCSYGFLGSGLTQFEVAGGPTFSF